MYIDVLIVMPDITIAFVSLPPSLVQLAKIHGHNVEIALRAEYYVIVIHCGSKSCFL